MAHYRVYSLDDEGHILGPANVITCDNDERAIDEVRKLKGYFSVEVWQADRLVAKIISRRAP
jgi:hypothetical protein